MKKVRLFLMLLMAAMLPLAMQAQQALPYSYGFEDNDLSADGWTRSDCHSSTGITTSSKMNGDYGFSFHWSTTPPQYLISPELTGTTSGVDVSFYYKKGGSFTETFMVGYSTTDASSSSFTWGEEITASSDWTLYNDFFPAGTKYIAIAYTANDQYYLYLDDFTFAAPATCAKPTAVTVADITTTSATISWTDNNMPTPSSWTIDVNGTEITGITANPYTIETLTHSTAYTVRVKAVCSETDASDWSNTVNFTTACDATVVDADHEFFEGFEETTFAPNCWNSIASGTYAWSRNTYQHHSGSASAHSGYYGDIYLVMPDLQIGNDNTDVWLKFWSYNSYPNDYDKNSVILINGNEETELWSPESVSSSWTETAINLSEYKGQTIRLAFKYEGSNAHDWYLDDITVSFDPTCLPPTEVTVDVESINPYGATISWTDNNNTDPENGWVLLVNDEEVAADANPFTLTDLTPETAYTVRVKAACTTTDSSAWSADAASFTTLPTCPAPTALTVDANSVTAHGATLSWTAGGEEESWIINYNGHDTTVIDNPFTFDNLTPATAYTVKVAAACSESDTSHWTSTVSFTTECEPVTIDEENVYYEDFEQYESNSFPLCWTRDIPYTNYSTTYPYVYNYSSYAHGGTKLMYMYYYGTSYSNLISTPTFTNDINTLQVSFFARYSSTNPTFVVGVMDGTTFEAVDTITLTSSYEEYTVMFNEYAGNGNRIAFKSIPTGTSSYSSFYVYLDDVTVELIPSCIKPSHLEVVEGTITTTEATISWTDNNNSEPTNGWTLLVNGTEVAADTNPFTLDNLTASTNYVVRVKANCAADDESDWSSDSLVFATACETYVVTEANPFAENFNALTADIPLCWDNEEGTTTNTSHRWNYYATGYTGACLRFNSYSNSLDNTNMLKTPVLDITALATPRVTFMYKNPTGGDFSVFVSTDGGETYTTALATGLTGVTNWTPMSIALEELDATDSVVIVFQGTSNYGNGDAYIYLDNVVVEETPACLAPTNLSLDTVTTTYFQVSWTDNNEETPASWTVAYSIDGGETFIEITGIDHDSAVVCNFDAPLGDINVMAKVKANCDVDAESAWSDEINFVTPPTCPAPTAIEYSNVTGNSVTLSWTAGGEETQWILSINGVETDIVTENPITIDTLTDNTPYVVRIRAYCGVSDTSVWNSGFVGFVTPCNAITAEDYSENFSGYTASNDITASNGVLPDCWNYIGTSGGYRPHVYNGTYSPTASDNCLVMTSGTSNYGGSTNFAVMPIFDDLTGKQLTFATAMESATMGTLTVGYVTDLTAESFVELETIPNNYYSNNRYVTHEVIVSSVPANARIAFRWYQATSWYSCAIDDIAIEDMPACVTPIDVAAADSTITATTAIISWVDYNLTTPASWIINLNGVDTAVTENPFTFYNLTPETEYTVMVMAACSETDSSEWSSEITFTTLPTCTAPRDVTITGITTTTATVAWTDRNETNPENGWIINLNGIDTIVTENPFTFDDLTSATSYTVKVAAFCSETDTSDWSATANFITPCETVVVTDQEPYTEGFEAQELTCWTNDIISGTLVWNIDNYNSAVGDQSVSFGGTYSSSGSAYLVSPIFDLTQITTEPQLSFYHKQAEYDDWYDSYNEELHVYYRTSPTDAWTLLADYTSNYEDFTQETMTLPNPTATYQIAFKGVEHNGYGVQLDEIVVEATPTCPKPTDLTASYITFTSAEIGWTPGGEETEWTVEVDGVDTIVTTNPITLTDLTPSTTYTIRVKANCSADDQSQWSNELAFTTACEAITIDDQFSEDFSGYTATNYNELGVMPTCWDAIAAGTYGPHVYAGSYGPNGSTDNALIFTSGSSSTYGSPNLAVLPEFTNDLQGYTLSFKAKLESSYAPGVLTYGYITGVDQTTFNAIDTVAASTTAQDFEYTLPSIPAGTRLAFCYSNSNIYYCCAIDDVVIFFSEETDSCATPTNVVVNNNVVTWTGDAANYNVQVTVAGEVVIDTTVATTTFTVEGLENNTHASVAVQAVCAEDDLSDWSEAVEFDYTNGINNYSLKANIYPNPTTGNVTVESDAINADITVFDAFGKLMMTSKVATERTELNFSEFAPGVYMVRIANDTAISTIKVVKK